MSFRVAFFTLGCKANQYDSAMMAKQALALGLRVVDYSEKADAYVINSCSVTATAARQSRQAAYRARRKNERALVLFCGCHATAFQEEVSSHPEFDAVIPRYEDGRMQAKVLDTLLEKAKLDTHPKPWPPEDFSPNFHKKTRPFLKVQDGCNARCAYCIIPKARGGKLSSLSIDDTLQAMRSLAESGAKEIVLTGIHIGQWGKGLDGNDKLIDLLDAIEKAAIVKRVRLSSIEPLELTDSLIDFLAKAKTLCPHLHLPLQSGSDEILKTMRRPYDTATYRNTVLKAKERIEGLGLGLDVIVGFPTETSAHFEETFAFIEALPVDYLHVFPFSPRASTPAATMHGQVDEQEKKRRTAKLIELGEEKRRASVLKMLGTTTEVLTEEKPDKATGLMKGMTGNYHRLLLDGAEDVLPDTLYVADIEKLAEDRMTPVGRVLA